MSWRAAALAGLVAALTLLAMVTAVRLGPAAPRDRRLRRHPGTWLLVVAAAIGINQVLFVAYVHAVHGGDPGFIARYLPAGWFALPDPGSPLARLALAVPAPHLVGWSVLRVQAFLELPFVLLAYLAVCRWWGAGTFGRAVRQVPLAAVGYTATFCLIEVSFWNPYTVDDLVLRVVAGVLVPFGLVRLAGPDGEWPAGAGPLLRAAGSTAALGVLVLVVYDAALLYNPGHLAAWLPVAAAATGALAVTRLAGRRSSPRPRLGVELLGRAVGWFLVLFFAPALALRYGLGFGARPWAAAAGLVLVAVAAFLAIRDVRDRTGTTTTSRLVAVAAATAASGTGGAVLAYALTGGPPEAGLLAAAAGFVAAALGGSLLVGDRLTRGPAAAPPAPTPPAPTPRTAPAGPPPPRTAPRRSPGTG